MSAESIVSTKGRILEMFSSLDEEELELIEQWISSSSYKKDLKIKNALQNSDSVLKKIGNAIKKLIPFEAEMPSENIVPPTVGDQADCNKINTSHVDEFLYDEDEVEKLISKGKLKKHYCLDCNSRNVKELTLISHSMSRQALLYVFNVLLPKDLEEKQILDVRSRLGAVLYAAYHLTDSVSIIGIEMNKECCELQERIIDQFFMDRNRIKIIHSDVTDKSDIVTKSDIIIINVLDFFVDNEKHKEMWFFFKKHIKKGSYLITNRSMADTFCYLEINEELMDWLSVCKPNQLENEVYFNIEDCCELFLYTIN